VADDRQPPDELAERRARREEDRQRTDQELLAELQRLRRRRQEIVDGGSLRSSFPAPEWREVVTTYDRVLCDVAMRHGADIDALPPGAELVLHQRLALEDFLADRGLNVEGVPHA